MNDHDMYAYICMKLNQKLSDLLLSKQNSDSLKQFT